MPSGLDWKTGAIFGSGFSPSIAVGTSFHEMENGVWESHVKIE